MGGSLTGDFKIKYTIEDLAQRLRANEQALSMHEQRFQAAMGGDPKVLNAQARYINAITSRTKEARIAQEHAAKSAGKLTDANKKLYQSTVMGTQGYRNFGVALRRVGLWSAAGGTVYGIIRLGRSIADIGSQFEYFRKELSALSEEGQDSLDQLASSAMLAAYDTGRSFNEAFEIAKAWIRTGQDAASTADLVRSTMVGMNLTNMGATEIMKALVAQLKAFDIAAEDSITIIDRLYGVARKHAIEPQQIAEGLQRFSSAAKTVGIDINQAYALMVGTLSRTQQSATMTGTAIRTIITRILKPSALDAIQTIAKIGPYADAAGESFRSVFDILGELATRWDSLTQTERVFLATTIAGVRRIDQFTAMMENWDEVLGANIDSMSTAGQAMRAQNILMDTLAKSVSKLSASWHELLATRSGFTDFLTDATRGLTLLIRKIQEMPDIARYLLEAIGFGAGALVGGPWGAGLAGGAIVGLEGLGAVGAIAKKSLAELRAEYQQHLKLQETTAESTWNLADRFLALGGEADGLTRHESELAKIQDALSKQVPELVSTNMSLASVYSTLANNVQSLGENYRDASVKVAEFELAESRLRLYRARARETAMIEELPTPKDAVPGLKGRLRSRLDMLGVYVLETIGKEDWAEAIIDRYYAPYMNLVKKLEKEGRYTIEGLRTEAENRWLMELSNMQQYLSRQDELTAAEKERMQAARDRVQFWREVYKRVLDYESAVRSVQAAEEQVKFWSDEISKRRALPTLTEPKGEGFIVPGLDQWMRAMKASILGLKKEMGESSEKAEALAGSAKEGSEWASDTLAVWRKSAESMEDIVEYTQVAGHMAKKLKDENVDANKALSLMGVYYDQLLPKTAAIKEKLAETVEAYGEGDERVERLNSLLGQAENLEGDILNLSKDWQNVAEETWEAHQELLDVVTQIKAANYENTHLGEKLSHAMEMASIEGGKFAALHTEIKALKTAMLMLDEDSANYLDIRAKLQRAINRLTQEEALLRRDMAQEWARNELEIELQLTEAHEGKLAALNQEWFYWAQISAYARDVEERQRAIMMMRSISAQEEVYLAQSKMQAVLQISNYLSDLIRGGGTMGGYVSGAGATFGSVGALMGWIKPETAIAVMAGSQIVGAVIDAIAGKTKENTDATDSNTRALLKLDDTMNDVREAFIGAIPTGYAIPPALIYGGRIPSLQGGGTVMRSGLAVVHEGEVRQAGPTQVIFNISGDGRSAQDIADEVARRLDRQFSIDSRRGISSRNYVS